MEHRQPASGRKGRAGAHVGIHIRRIPRIHVPVRGVGLRHGDGLLAAVIAEGDHGLGAVQILDIVLDIQVVHVALGGLKGDHVAVGIQIQDVLGVDGGVLQVGVGQVIGEGVAHIAVLAAVHHGGTAEFPRWVKVSCPGPLAGAGVLGTAGKKPAFVGRLAAAGQPGAGFGIA